MTTEMFTSTEFYSDPRRKRSGEVDFGVMWMKDAPWPHWRVSWIRDTGEVYACMQAREPSYEVFGKIPTRKDVEAALVDWWEHCGEIDGLLWVKQQVENYEASHVDDVKPGVFCTNCGSDLQATVERTSYWTFKDNGFGQIYVERAFNDPPTWEEQNPEVRIYCANDCPLDKLGLSVDKLMALEAIARAAEAR